MLFFSLLFGMFVYRVEKSKVATEEALFVLFNLFIKIILDCERLTPGKEERFSMTSFNLLIQYFQRRSSSAADSLSDYF